MTKINIHTGVWCGVIVGTLLTACTHQPEVGGWRGVQHNIVLSFLGDIMAHRPNFNMDDYSRIYRGVSEILRADAITFANLETPVDNARPYHTWPRFNVHSPYVEAAVEGGVNFFSLANNHTADWGVNGIISTIKLLEQIRIQALFSGHHVYYGGVRPPEQSSQYLVTEVWRRGWHIGILALTHFLNDPNNGKELVHIADYTNPTQRHQVLETIAQHANAYDLLVVSYHGGVEYRTTPDPKKVVFFQQMIAAGADIVWGHHPHVLQPWQVIERKGRVAGVILYSLGNFISAQNWFVSAHEPTHPDAFTGDSLILQLKYEWSRSRPYLQEVDAIPISHWKDEEGGVEVRTFHDLLNAGDIGAAWSRYYHHRYKILHNTFGASRGIVFPPVWLML